MFSRITTSLKFFFGFDDDDEAAGAAAADIAQGHKPIEARLINGLHVSEDCQIIVKQQLHYTVQAAHPVTILKQ